MASLALAAPAAASGGIWCEGDGGASVEIATGRLPVLQINGANVAAGDRVYSTDPERGEGTPFVVGQAFAGDDDIMVDFVDPNFEAILVSLRLHWQADREQDWPLAGTLALGGDSYSVRCGAD